MEMASTVRLEMAFEVSMEMREPQELVVQMSGAEISFGQSLALVTAELGIADRVIKLSDNRLSSVLPEG